MARLPTISGAPPKHLFLMRHGETTWNSSNRIQGHRDPPLSLKGRRQVQATANHLPHRQIERIFSSDLRRAVATARLVREVVDAPMTVLPTLREIDLGAWEGLTPDQVNRRFNNGYAKWLASPAHTRIPKAETHTAFCRRVERCWRQELIVGHEQTILVSTHGGFIAPLLAYLLHAHYDAFIVGLAIDNASLTHVVLHGAHVRVEMINHTWHRK